MADEIPDWEEDYEGHAGDMKKELASKDKQIEYYRADRDRLGKIEIEKDKRIKELSTECANLLVDSTTAMNNMKTENAAFRKENKDVWAKYRRISATREGILVEKLDTQDKEIADLKAKIAKIRRINNDAAEGCAGYDECSHCQIQKALKGVD